MCMTSWTSKHQDFERFMAEKTPNFLNNALINAEVETINLGHLAFHLFLNPSLQVHVCMWMHKRGITYDYYIYIYIGQG